VGFLNQLEISRAYVAADCLVLPSDAGETWGLVVNEALASGLPCVASDACGCAEDLVAVLGEHHCFRCGDVDGLASAINATLEQPPGSSARGELLERYSFGTTIALVHRLLGIPQHRVPELSAQP
jgi:glycosyltransferase involved in cell wall biosynthesis